MGLRELFLHHELGLEQRFQHFRDVQQRREKIAAFAEKSEGFIRKQKNFAKLRETAKI